MRVGLIVNPVAGLGGPVGLKGTDGPESVAEALRRGARAQSGIRARRAMARLAARVPGVILSVASGELGSDWLTDIDLDLRPVATGALTGTARDTRNAAEAMSDLELIVFAGGDGTARDIKASLRPGMAMLGIPGGVKMHSGVFAISPEAAGALLADIVSTPERVIWDDEAEVMDIDEAELRAGRIAPRLYSHARAPVARNRMQAAKGAHGTTAGAALAAAAGEVANSMTLGTLYIIGPGTSAAAVMHAAGHEASLLGIDALRDGNVLAWDATANELERLAGDGPVRIVLGVTGRQGFLLGRGNQPISPRLISRAGREGLIILATEEKLACLAQPNLWVDTGEPRLDAILGGFVRVRTGARREMMMRIAAS